jgi:hypothetical protein
MKMEDFDLWANGINFIVEKRSDITWARGFEISLWSLINTDAMYELSFRWFYWKRLVDGDCRSKFDKSKFKQLQVA